MSELVVGPDDPDDPDVRALLAAHLAFARHHSPPEDVHALDVAGLQAGLLAGDVSFFSIRDGEALLGVGALRHLDAGAPARALYASVGFTVCPPFGEYFVSPNSVCMTRSL